MPGKKKTAVYKKVGFGMPYQGNHSAFPFKSSPTKFGFGGLKDLVQRISDKRARKMKAKKMEQKFIDRRREKQEHPLGDSWQDY